MPAMWNIGYISSVPCCPGGGSTPESSAVARACSATLSRFVTWLRWVPTAPFGRPVVPEV